MRTTRRTTGRRWSGTVWAWNRVCGQMSGDHPVAFRFQIKVAEAAMDRRKTDEVSLALTPGEEDILESIMDSDEELNGEIARDD